MKKVSCIIPTYNEGPRIGSVLEAVIGHPLVDEIIVVDDASTDGTKDFVSKFENINLVVHEKNKGKSVAVCSGVKQSSGEFIFLLDADLVGLKDFDITQLIDPVLSGKADVSISLRRNTPKFWRLIGIDYISGERVLPRKILSDNLEKISLLSRFGLEVFMNKIIIELKLFHGTMSIVLIKMKNTDFGSEY